jgi:glycosyltransferase involved in cell wall biosynthesis
LRTLERYIDALDLGDAVTITGALPQAALVSYFRHADVFVCLSEHEGFCIPLLESMWHEVPIVAMASSAVPETLGGAGLVLPSHQGGQPQPAVVAAAVHKVLTNDQLRAKLVEAGRNRVADFALDKTSARFAEAVASVLNDQ